MRAAKQLGRRGFDVFLGDKARQLETADFELAEHGKTFFSLFRCTAPHGIAGAWLDDLLDGNRSLWLMDESLEASAPAMPHGVGNDLGQAYAGRRVVPDQHRRRDQSAMQQ